MLDDINVLKQKDPNGLLSKVGDLKTHLDSTLEVHNKTDAKTIDHIVIAGMGGSSLAADLVKTLLNKSLQLPLEVIKDYELPASVDKQTLFIASSYSGNTEETLSCLKQARLKGCQLAIITSGGKLGGIANKSNIANVEMPSDMQPRVAMIVNLRAILTILEHFEVIDRSLLDEIEAQKEWLEEETRQWRVDTPTERNYAKQLALATAGKTPIFYGGPLTAPIAYKWKISWNENAKNLAFHNQYPEFNHNEFIGWTSHPIEKPFVVFDLISRHEQPKIVKRMELSDKLLSGLRPKSQPIHLVGQSFIQEALWGILLADYASIYTAMINGVNPEPVKLVEKLKEELAN